LKNCDQNFLHYTTVQLKPKYCQFPLPILITVGDGKYVRLLITRKRNANREISTIA